MKTVLITGASSGIGRATAEIFIQNNDYRLIICGRRKERLEKWKNNLHDNLSTRIHIVCFDIRNQEQCANALNTLPEPFQHIDILVNNAGLALGFDPVQNGNLEHWETMIDTNIKGLLYMTRLVSRIMVENKKGHIINICSTAGKDVYPNGNVYCATKFAVDALTKAIRQDLYTHGIRVSQVAPGHVEETEFAITRFEGNQEKAAIYKDFNPLKAKDVAETIYFIATRPDYVNIQDVLMMGTQQAPGGLMNRSGRIYDK